jgi:hypothetical protein
LESLVAGAILATAATLALQAISATTAARRRMEVRQAALREAENALERLSAEPWDAGPPQALAAWQLSPAAQARLRGGQIEIIATPADGAAAGWRVSVEVRWAERTDQAAASVRLTSWVYPANASDAPSSEPSAEGAP